MRNPSSELEGLPERVSVFGISTLPRFHIQILSSISRFTQVNLFLMNPCMEYWGDISSDWEIKRATDKGQMKLFEAEELHLGRDFFDLIHEFDCEDMEFFKDSGQDSLLTCIQSDILKLRERSGDPGEKTAVPDGDMSIQIHSCHIPMRG